jgi:flagellar assembly factor FliW
LKIVTKRFGELDASESEIWTLIEALPGLPDLGEFVLLEPDDDYPVVWLQAVSDDKTCLPLISTFDLMPDYSFDIDESSGKELAIDSPEDLLVFTVLVIPAEMSEMTANLAAPILVNKITRRAKQVILDNAEYPVRYPVFVDICERFSDSEGN